MGRFFVALRKDGRRLCGRLAGFDVVTFLQPGQSIYAILVPDTAKINECYEKVKARKPYRPIKLFLALKIR
jgi:hypothetical protein